MEERGLPFLLFLSASHAGSGFKVRKAHNKSIWLTGLDGWMTGWPTALKTITSSPQIEGKQKHLSPLDLYVRSYLPHGSSQ